MQEIRKSIFNNKHNSKHLYNNKSSIMAEMNLLILLCNKNDPKS